MLRVAVIGAGIAGLSAAWHLSQRPGGPRVTLFEAEPRFGGHAHTVDLTLDGITHGVDAGFLVFNERTYPGLIGLFDALEVPTAASEMSFSVQAAGLEWSGRDLAGVFAQRRNLARPRFWAMLADILRFHRVATARARAGGDAAQTVGEFLAAEGFGGWFREAYFLPMIGSIWSCPTAQMLDFPVDTLLAFCHHHGLLQLHGRPRWFTVRGGSRRYVDKIVQALPDARSGCPVRAVRRHAPGAVWVETTRGGERFDAVVLAAHAPQNLALLADASADECDVLGALRTQPNRVVLHTDAGLLPKARAAWAAWNYEAAAGDARVASGSRPVCLHYLVNRLQPLPWSRPVIVSMNPLREPDPAQVHAEFAWAHPVFDRSAVEAQQRLPAIQGRGGVWHAGAWMGNGFHEDGFVAGRAAAEALLARLGFVHLDPWPHAA